MFLIVGVVCTGYEALIGYNDIKTATGVYFYVKRSTLYSSASTVIPYQVEQLNIGGAMNLASGVFTAPTNGRYHFSFNGHAWGTDSYVHIRLNGGVVAHSSAPTYNNLPIMATLSLNKGDKVDTWLDGGSLNTGSVNYATQFTGILLEEDLVFQ